MDSIDAESLLNAYPVLRYFEYGHLSIDLQEVSKSFCDLAYDVALINWPKTSGEVGAALRKLLESRDCAVRAAL